MGVLVVLYVIDIDFCFWAIELVVESNSLIKPKILHKVERTYTKRLSSELTDALRVRFDNYKTRNQK